MTQLETLMLDVTNTLNHNGFDEVKAVPNNTQFSIRVGYWDRISASLIETMEEYHSIHITEQLIEDEDCGELYNYIAEVVDEDTGYTLNELNDLESNYTEEMWLEAESRGVSIETITSDWGVA